MSHRNNDNNGPWNNRNPRNNNNEGGGGGGYKDRAWGGNNRYGGSDNRYNKDRRNYRGYGGGGRRNNYDGRPYRGNNTWINNGGVSDGNYPRYQNNWHPKHSGNKPVFTPDIDALSAQQIPPLMIDFEADSEDQSPRREQQSKTESPAKTTDGGKDNDQTTGSGVDKEATESGNKSWGNDDFGSPGDGFQGFADVECAKKSNGDSNNTFASKASPEKDVKNDISIQENELSKIIVDEAMKIISDAEQPSCSSASQNNSAESRAPATTPTASNPNPERRASIERSAEQVTRKLINQLTSMNKHSLKQMINNPDSKYETALKTHARQKLRAEVRRQLRNFNLNESAAQPKTTASMLEPDESVDSDKIPDALLEQIGKVLDLNLLDLNVTEEPVPDPDPAPVPTVGEEEENVINTSDADYSATEVLDKNLQLTDEDGQFDTDDLFARAELLLMKGSESVRQGNSSGPSSPTDEMFPNEQIDSIVSEDNGIDPNESESEQIERMLDEPLRAVYPCFLRVSTVEELNKKVDTLPVPVKESEICTVEVAVPLLPPPELMDDSSISNLPPNEESIPLVPVLPEEQNAPSFEIIAEPDVVNLVEESSVPTKEDPVPEPPVTNVEETEVIQNTVADKVVEEAVGDKVVEDTVVDKVVQDTVEDKVVQDTVMDEADKVEEVPKLESVAPIASPPKQSTAEPSPGTIRAPTHPELAARKTKGSKTYKPNLVQHEPSKRDTTSKPSPASTSQTASSSGHASSPSNSRTASKPGTATNLNNAPKPSAKDQNSNNNNATSNKTENSGKTRGRSRVRRDVSGSKETTAQPNGTTSPSNTNHVNKSSNNGSLPVVAAAAAATVPANGSRPAPQAPPVEQPPALRSVRAKTPGPALAGGPQDHSSPLGVKKKKKKHNRRRDRSPPPDSGMMLECDLRVSRPVVTPTPPPVQTRDTAQPKKSHESDRSSTAKPSREMRAKSADPKLYYESKKERDRNKERGRNRDDDKKSRSKEDKKESEKEERKEKETRRGKEVEITNGTATNATVEGCKSEPSISKPDHRSERRKSPVSKPVTKLSVDAPKHAKESKDEPKEIPKEIIEENEKEAPKEITKECLKETTKESNLKEVEDKELSRDKEATVVQDCKEETSVLEDLPKEKESSDVPNEPSKPAKPHKKKKSLLRGPNLIKGRREVPQEPETPVPSQQKEDDEVQIVETTPPPSESNVPVNTTPVHCYSRQREVPTVAVTQSPSAVAVPLEHHNLMVTSAASLIQRTASPRPWKSPGEKKLIPPSPAIISHPMSPPSTERVRRTPTPTPPSPAMSPEPPQRVHLVASPAVMPQPEVLTSRIPLQSTLTPLSAATAAVPQINAFAPVMALLNQMQDIDNRMSDFQRRKMQIDSEMMRLNSEKFQIDQNSMQLQNERFMLLNSLRAALVECELTTLATMQSISHIPAAVSSPIISHRRRNPEPNLDAAPKTKRRKEASDAIGQPISAAVSSLTDLSESEEPVNPCSVSGGERTIRRITKISGNTEILKLFQRRRLISDRSAEESQSEDNSTPHVAPNPPVTTEPAVAATVDKPTPAKRRRTRTYGGNVGGSEQREPPPTGGRLRSDSTKSVESAKPDETLVHPSSAQPGPSAGPSSRFKKDEEIPLVRAQRRLLPREVKVVLSKLNVASKRGSEGT